MPDNNENNWLRRARQAMNRRVHLDIEADGAIPPEPQPARPAGARAWDNVQWDPFFFDHRPAVIGGPFKKELPVTGKRGEELFQLILSGLREIYDIEAVIAGGAVRDTAAGVTRHKDVDVFIPMKWEDFIKHDTELGWQGDIMRVKSTKYEECVIPSSARAQASVQGCPVDLVFLDKPLDPKGVETFPIHAQRAIWTLKEGLVLSPEAKKDIEAKTFTISPTITNKEKIAKLVEKAKVWTKREGYEGWTVVTPELPEWWEKEIE